MARPQVDETAHSSPALFADDARFANPDDFFAEATRRLVRDWGYVVERSTERPRKITGRCERFDQGCPFRLCAILPEGEPTWRINTNSCSWVHSHPARSSSGRFKPRPGAAADDSATNTASEPAGTSLTVVLFGDGTRFATSEAFFRQVNDTSKRLCGMGCTKHSETDTLLVARCTTRYRTRCRYKVHAVPAVSGGYILDAATSEWVHNHRRNSMPPFRESGTANREQRDKYSTALAPPMKPAQTRKFRSEMTHLGPQIGDRFRDFNEAFLAAASISIVTLGNSVARVAKNELAGGIYCHYGRGTEERCSYKLNVGRSADGKGCVVLATSHPVHSHGPCPELQADPTWRPNMRDRDLIRAVEAFRPAGTVKPKRTSSPVVEITFVSPKSKRLRLASDSAAAASASAPSPASSIYPSPTLSDSSLPSPQLGRPRLLTDPAAGVPLVDRIALVEAFLAGVDPAQTELAPHLVAAGVDSLEALVGFATLTPALRQGLLDELERRGGTGLARLGGSLPS
ncbi:hypothetical protein BMF94_0325 [Rhodotorula taiwanensis]|uniref:Uncharacterized protein n=1 Tax=Rhodotorula taiwanensis TaxID=741276 RepID=A0A2S5BJ02_9BASI|nr:hypothetical protein BMF94_0325 [Rhodotorula taiwanensis]